MVFLRRIATCILLIVTFLNSSYKAYAAEGDTTWAKSVVIAPNQSYFDSVAVDTSGNIYAAGFIGGSGTFNFGNSVTVSGANGTKNLVVVKYNSSGVAQWAKSAPTAATLSEAYDVVIDSVGNIYISGFLYGNGSVGLGDSVTVSGGNAAGRNGFVAKYNSSGVAQWAMSVSTAPSDSEFMGVEVDSADLPYIVGYISGTGTYDFGNSVTATGTHTGTNLLIAKYNAGGVAQWARTTSSGTNNSYYEDISIDTSDNIFVAGYIQGNAAFGFGNSVTVTAVYGSGSNALLVKYNTSGLAQWARTTTVSATRSSNFTGVSTDGSGNVYVVGQITNTDLFQWGNSITTSGAYALDTNGVIIKYDSSGTPLWASTATTAPNTATFGEIFTDSNGNSYVGGNINGSGTYNFGNSVTLAGDIYHNVFVLKYNSSGVAQWGKTQVSGADDAGFNDITVDSSGNAFGAGFIRTNGAFNFGNSITVNGVYASSYNIVLVKYEGPPVTKTLTYTAGANGTISGTASQVIVVGQNGTTVTAVPNANYHFVDWSDGVLTATRQDTNITDNISVTANFAVDVKTLAYTAGENGAITGITSQSVNVGSNGTTVTAVPNANYHFVDWSDGILTATRQDTNITDNISVTANFSIDRSDPGPQVQASTTETPACTDSAPLSTTNLFQINTKNNLAKLYFSPVAQVHRYFISFSSKPLAEEHGSEVELTNEGVQSYTVFQLKPNMTYYFKIRPQIGCMPGKWSNIMKVVTQPSGATRERIFYQGQEKRIFLPVQTIRRVVPVQPSQTTTQVIEPSEVLPKVLPETVKAAPAKKCFLWWCY